MRQAFAFESDDPALAGTMTMTWELTPAVGGTAVEVVAENVPAGISKEDHRVRHGIVAREPSSARGGRYGRLNWLGRPSRRPASPDFRGRLKPEPMWI